MSKDWESEFADDELEKYNLKAVLDNLNDKDKKIIYDVAMNTINHYHPVYPGW